MWEARYSSPLPGGLNGLLFEPKNEFILGSRVSNVKRGFIYLFIYLFSSEPGKTMVHVESSLA